MDTYLVAAYNAAPPGLTDDSELETAWYAMLRSDPLIGGLELGFSPGLHPKGPEHLATLLRPDWTLVLTTMAGTIAGVAANANYGLASDDPAGREAALDDVRRLHREAEVLGRTVLAVELQSAPNRGQAAASAESFAESLAEIVSWPWGGSRIVVEHCDAYVPGQQPQKGYLSLAEELRATDLVATRTGAAIGHAVNWGRSAIETRDGDGPETHLRELAAAGKLVGLMFSGAGGTENEYGTPWKDVHLPMAEDEPASLLTGERMQRALALAPDVAYLGIKVGASPRAEGVDRFTVPRRMLETLARLSG